MWRVIFIIINAALRQCGDCVADYFTGGQHKPTGEAHKKARAASASIYLIRNHAEKMSVVIHRELEEERFVLILFFVVAVSPTFELNCQQKASNQTK